MLKVEDKSIILATGNKGIYTLSLFIILFVIINIHIKEHIILRLIMKEKR